MITALKNWKGAVTVDSTKYNNIQDAMSDFKSTNSDIHIILHSATQNEQNKRISVSESASSNSNEVIVTVKAYMTKKATADFDFMLKWNNDIPMPMRVMQGTVEKETRGMVYMKLHGLARPTITCYCCGKELTNPISRHYGIGPICLGKLGIQRDIEDVENIKEELVDITWEGWIIRSAILSKEVIE